VRRLLYMDDEDAVVDLEAGVLETLLIAEAAATVAGAGGAVATC